jgi:hypothetical protein
MIGVGVVAVDVVVPEDWVAPEVAVDPVVPAAGAPTGTIGLGGVDVLVESEADACVVGGAFWPSGTTMGVGCVSPPPPPPPPPLSSLPASDSSCGGQSTAVGGQLSALPDPDDGGEQPAPAPKSPAVVQSASATPTGSTAHPMNEKAATTSHIRDVLTA